MYQADEPDLGILKKILPLMSHHAAGYHPISYTVWYQYVKGERQLLRQCIDEEIKRKERLTVETTYGLYSKHLVEPAERALLTARSNLLGLVDQIKYAVQQADSDTTGFDARLNDFQRNLGSATSFEDLGNHVSQMLAETQRLSSGLGQLTSQLDQSKTEVRRLTDELHLLREDALTDALSGLLNRRAFDLELQRLTPKDGVPDCALSVIMFDIDHFKMVNDTYGHPLGDVVIAAVGRSILECVGAHGVAARYGGEEFAVLLPQISLAAAEALAESVRARVEQGKIRRRKGDEPIGGVTISAGIASRDADDSPESLIDRADRALYASKRAGRNRVTVHARECTQ